MISTILIDDEVNSLNSLKKKINNHFPQLEIKAICNKAEDGLNAIEELRPDLVFLDIEMPIMNGFTLLQNLNYKNFSLIFVTAYDHYAIKAIKYSALDYLVKPVEIEELKNAIDRVIDKKHNVPNKRLELLLENVITTKIRFNKIAIPSVDGLHLINVHEIIYLEASSNYTALYTMDSKKYMASRSLKEFEELLPSETFIRIHNSIIINKNFVERYIRGEGGQVILEGNITLDISKRKKADFLKAVGMLR